MPDKDEKARRKQILREQREEKRAEVRRSLPAPPGVLKALFNYLDSQLSASECDNTLRHAEEFVRNNNLPLEPTVHWLKENHGFCDCEVLMNVEEVVEDAVPGYGDL